MIGLVSAAHSGRQNDFIMYIPIAMHAILICASISQQPLGLPYVIVTKAPPLCWIFAAINKQRTILIRLKSDTEIWVGLYVIFGWFFSRTTLLQNMLFWQVMRIRFILNDNCKLAFYRLNEKLDKYVVCRLPAPLKRVYDFLKSAIVSMGASPNDAVRSQLSGEQSLAQTIGSSFRKCTIF